MANNEHCESTSRSCPDVAGGVWRDLCGDLPAAEQREWLVTNGIGGFASGTIAGIQTRRYHGLLVAALKPPLGRTVLVAKLEETAEYHGRTYALGTNRWAGGALDAQGFRHIEKFLLESTTPVWTFALADAQLEKRVWMQPGANTTYIEYRLVRGGHPIRLEIKALVNFRDYHATTHASDWQMNIEPLGHGLRVTAVEGATPFYLLSAKATAERTHVWYRNFNLAAARYRGLDDHEDHLQAGTFRATLGPADFLTLVCSTEPAPDVDGCTALEARLAGEQTLLDRWAAAQPSGGGMAVTGGSR